MHIIVGMSPYRCCAEAKKLWDPQGISSSNVMHVVSITDYSHTFSVWGSRGITSKIAEHVIILYLLWHLIYMYQPTSMVMFVRTSCRAYLLISTPRLTTLNSGKNVQQH